MNKKIIIFYICMTILMICIGITFAVSINTKNEKEKAVALKEVLMILDETNSSDKNGYEISFIKDVDYEDKEDGESSVVDYTAHYESSGSFKLSYENGNSNKVSLEDGFQSFFKYGKGFISGVQNETHVINNSEINKKTNEIIRKESYNNSISNEFLIDNTTDIQVLSNTKYSNNADNTRTSTDSFAGKINKDILFDTYELSKFNQAVDQIMFIDVWDDVNSLLKLIYNSLAKIDYNNQQELNNFVKNKNFVSKITNDTIQISYYLDLDDKLNDNTENKYDNIYFLLKADINTKEIKQFMFDLSKYYSSILKYDSNNSNESLSKVNYYIEGRINNNTLDKKDISSIQYKEYTDETKYDFVDEFINHAIPTREDIY